MILVDQAIWQWRGGDLTHRRPDLVGVRWSHLVSDHSYDELHVFAIGLGLERRWFQGDHYDIPAPVREQAIARGAEPVDARELVRRLREAGLRVRR